MIEVATGGVEVTPPPKRTRAPRRRKTALPSQEVETLEATLPPLLQLKDIPLGTPVSIPAGVWVDIPSTEGILVALEESDYPDRRYPEIRYITDGKLQTTILYTEPSYSSTFLTSTDLQPLEKKELERFNKMYREAIVSRDNTLPLRSGTITNGCDPEIFGVGEDGVCIPAWKWLPSKENSKTLSEPSSNGCPWAQTYWDGFQAEFGVRPHICASWLVDGIRLGLQLTQKALYKYSPTARISLDSVVKISDEERYEASNEHVSLGCTPSLNVYGDRGAPVDDPRSLQWRFAGGHLHLGSGKLDPGTAARVVRLLDATVGIASVGMFEGVESPLRRRWYGRAGEYRLPAYGLEYRVLSNAWLAHPALAFWMFDMCRAAVSVELSGYTSYLLPSLHVDEGEIRRVINQGDVQTAREYCKRNWVVYEKMVMSYYRDIRAVHMSNVLIQHGVRSLMDPLALEQNWRLSASYGKDWKTDWLSHAEVGTFRKFVSDYKIPSAAAGV